MLIKKYLKKISKLLNSYNIEKYTIIIDYYSKKTIELNNFKNNYKSKIYIIKIIYFQESNTRRITMHTKLDNNLLLLIQNNLKNNYTILSGYYISKVPNLKIIDKKKKIFYFHYFIKHLYKIINPEKILSINFSNEIHHQYSIDSHKNFNIIKTYQGNLYCTINTQKGAYTFYTNNLINKKEYISFINNIYNRAETINSSKISSINNLIFINYEFISRIFISLVNSITNKVINNNKHYLKAFGLNNKISIYDIPLLKNGNNNYMFDYEGFLTKGKTLINKGKLYDTLSDYMYSKKNKTHTGNSYLNIEALEKNILSSNIIIKISENKKNDLDYQYIVSEINESFYYNNTNGYIVGSFFVYKINNPNICIELPINMHINDFLKRIVSIKNKGKYFNCISNSVIIDFSKL